jgi:hypothetical protein
MCFYYFCLMIEGSGSGSVSLTNGSGSGRPKNIWILRIRIRNTAVSSGLYLFQKRQKAGEDGEEDEKEADISQSGVGLEHGNQSFTRVLMKICVKQFNGTARIDN